MPPFPTTPCFASRPSPDTTTTIPSPLLLHPAMEFMHSFVHSWCETHTAHSKPYTEWFTPDFELGSHDGRRFRGETAARAFVESMRGYERSTVEIDAVYLEEVEGGYQGLAMGRIFLDFVVAGGKGEGEKEGEKTCVDGEGMGWDFCVSCVSFHRVEWSGRRVLVETLLTLKVVLLLLLGSESIRLCFCPGSFWTGCWLEAE